jgi:hypothetical protein
LAQDSLKKPIGLEGLDNRYICARSKNIAEPVEEECSEVNGTCHRTNEDNVSEDIPNPPWLRHLKIFFVNCIPRKSGQGNIEQKVLN